MQTDHEKPTVLALLQTEAEAALMVQALEAQGIVAQAVGGLTSGFRAEAPGRVQVLVRQMDLAEAREILRELREG